MKFPAEVKLLRSEVSPFGEVYWANLTSLGANIHEANYASSKADFINKFHIALKECVETEYWIEMLIGCNAISQESAQSILQECGVIHRMLAKSITTAKKEKQNAISAP